MHKEILGYITLTMSIIGYIPYLRDTWSGKTTPHALSWLTWSVLGFIGFGLQYTHGAGPASWPTILNAFISLSIFLLALKKSGLTIKLSDYFFIGLSIISAVLWIVADSPVWATFFQVSAGVIAIFPTFIKLWDKPESETKITWILNSIRHFITSISATNYTFITVANPITWGVVNFSMVAFAYVRGIYLNRNKA